VLETTRKGTGVWAGMAAAWVPETLQIKASDSQDLHDFTLRSSSDCVPGTAETGNGHKIIPDVDKVPGEAGLETPANF